jgi:hypothetical protein
MLKDLLIAAALIYAGFQFSSSPEVNTSGKLSHENTATSQVEQVINKIAKKVSQVIPSQDILAALPQVPKTFEQIPKASSAQTFQQAPKTTSPQSFNAEALAMLGEPQSAQAKDVQYKNTQYQSDEYQNTQYQPEPVNSYSRQSSTPIGASSRSSFSADAAALLNETF